MLETYHFKLTDDGSPTLIMEGQAMHNRRGAFGETLAVYGAALDEALARGLRKKFAVIGMGLGYVEFMIAARLIGQDYTIQSFEASPLLRDQFLNWLHGQNKRSEDFPKSLSGHLPENLPQNMRQNLSGMLNASFNGMAEKFSDQFIVPTETVRQELCRKNADGHWAISGPLKKDTLFESKASVIFYDLFSSQIQPEFWTEEFLHHFIQKATDKACVFSSYSACGNLKRALRKSGFEVRKCKGFGGKREKTLAVRV